MNATSRMEFSWKNGKPGDAFLSLVGAIVGLIIMPLCLCTLVVGIGKASIASGNPFMDPAQIESMAADYWYYTRRFISLAGPLVIASIPLGFYPKGSYAKIPFRLFFSFYLALVLLIFVHGGAVESTIGGMDSSGSMAIESITLSLNVTAIVYIAVMISVARGFLAFAEFAGHRREYLEWLDEKERTYGEKATDGASE